MAESNRDGAGTPHASAARGRTPVAGALGRAIGPLTKTGSYYARSWRDYIDHRPGELPIARPTIALAAHAFRDEIVLLGLRARRPVSDAPAFKRIQLEVDAALEFYGDKGWRDKPRLFFEAPPPLTDVTVVAGEPVGVPLTASSSTAGTRRTPVSRAATGG